MKKNALVLGGGGFIGSHLVNRLRLEGYWIRVVDLKHPDFAPSRANDFIVGDLRDQTVCNHAFAGQHFDEVYQLAADMGGAGYIFTGENDANIMHNSALINLNITERCLSNKVGKVFYSSSACMYPAYNQEDPNNPKCSEDSAYPAAPDSEYGWEKLFSERLYLAFSRNYNMNVRIARYHNIFGPQGTWDGGKEKAPAALCRKVAQAKDGTHIDVWGDGKQTRSFLYIDECIEATRRLMNSEFTGPVNIGSEEMISINDLAKMVIDVSRKQLSINNISGPVGVRGRNSDNKLYSEKIGWVPSQTLREGIEKTYSWINEKVVNQNKKEYVSVAQLDIMDKHIIRR
jgi:GDP-D-mannose 3',5'-epimerase